MMKPLSAPFKSIFFLGIGGIGMSALARYFLSQNLLVYGYDKTPSDLTAALMAEGAHITYEDEVDTQIHALNSNDCLVVYTPAIPASSLLFNHFLNGGFKVQKRAETLGWITRSHKALCVAGTHGKSTTSALLAHLLHHTEKGCNAFLGAISTDFNSNLVLNSKSDFTIVEADEYDRSFLFLSPHAAIVTNVDPDHLDIYGTADKFIDGFKQFAFKIDPAGLLVVKEGVELTSLCRQITYALNSTDSDYGIFNIRQHETHSVFDVRTPVGNHFDVFLGIPGLHNAENALACIALLIELGIDFNVIKPFLKSFSGLKRRFEIIFKGQDLIYIDDYAHHPTEIQSLVNSLRGMFPDEEITGVFQPHLFSRTRDFGDGFATELAKLDRLILLPIYPARELPIDGIDASWLFRKINMKEKSILQKSELLQAIIEIKKGVLVTIGAGDIDRLVSPIKQILEINEFEA